MMSKIKQTLKKNPFIFKVHQKWQKHKFDKLWVYNSCNWEIGKAAAS